MTFKRETRYVVMKIKDMHAALSEGERMRLMGLFQTVSLYRHNSGKRPFECVVVESDWPEYEPTWKAIEERMEQESEDSGQFGVGA